MINSRSFLCRTRSQICVSLWIALAWVSVGLPMKSGWARSVQESRQLVNGELEVWQSEKPKGWMFLSNTGGTLAPSDDRVEGNLSARIDATKITGQRFTNLMQSIDAQAWQGKTVRYRAAVKTAELARNSKVQLWLRVDRKTESGENAVGAFDNMDDRPIQTTEWQHFEIVAKVDDDANQIVLGVFVIGGGIALIDDVSFEIVDSDVKLTAKSLDQKAMSSFQMPEVLKRAFQNADKAPQQSFWNPWLILVACVLAMFAISGLPAQQRYPSSSPTNELLEETEALPVLGFIPKFALHFTFAYWLLYGWLSIATGFLVPLTATYVFGIEGELVPPNGSGDTTFNYLQAFNAVVIAFLIAAVVSALDRSPSDRRHMKDFMASYLRYYLASVMLSYGMAKVAWDMNQFPTPEEFQLGKTWGESSPMNVVWAWMGSSRPYTVFAGAGEILGALLLIWRRTATLGALVVVGVMTNVFMLNMCYDIPVKLHSFHYLVMAVVLLLPDLHRLAAVLLFNSPTEPRPLGPTYTDKHTIWAQRCIKAAVILFLVGIPLGSHINRQVRYFNQAGQAKVDSGETEKESSLLLGRGFRWINEVPFNR